MIKNRQIIKSIQAIRGRAILRWKMTNQEKKWRPTWKTHDAVWFVHRPQVDLFVFAACNEYPAAVLTQGGAADIFPVGHKLLKLPCPFWLRHFCRRSQSRRFLSLFHPWITPIKRKVQDVRFGAKMVIHTPFSHWSIIPFLAFVPQTNLVYHHISIRQIWRHVHATLHTALSVRRSVSPSHLLFLSILFL